MAPLTSILSLDFPLQDSRVVPAKFSSDETGLGHDLICWDAAATLNHYLGNRSNPLTQASTARLNRDFERRDEEFQEHLSAGRPIVIFLGSRQAYQADYPGVGYYADETVESHFPVPVSVKSASGRSFELMTGDPFASFWAKWGGDFTHRAIIEDPPGTALLRISKSTQVVAMAAEVGTGLVLMLPELAPEFMGPHPEEAAPSEIDGDFVEDLWRVLASWGGSADLPTWAGDYEIAGEAEATTALSGARRQAERAQERVKTSEAELAEMREKKLLFTGSGAALERVVGEAFRALGFEVEAGTPGRTDRIIKRKKRIAVVEVKGKSKSASERDSAQLTKWVSDELASGRKAKPILVVNTWRNKPLEQRTEDDFPKQMLPYAVVQQKQCLMTGLQLLGLWLEVLAHPSRADALALEVLRCEGQFERYRDWKDVARLTAALGVEEPDS